jgi:nucleoside 2-deoxyribosyltransferase
VSDVFQIYLAGGMQNLSFEEQNEWREKLCDNIMIQCYKINVDTKAVNIINPVDYYNFDKKLHKTEKEVMNFDTNFVRNSDLIIVNANDPKSIGTSMEIAIAHEHRIPILILNDGTRKLHPWWTEMADRVFDDFETLCTYVVDFYIKMEHYSVIHNVLIK